jgi:hypothetical protein
VLLHTGLSGVHTNNVFIKLNDTGSLIVDSCAFGFRSPDSGGSSITGYILDSTDPLTPEAAVSTTLYFILFYFFLINLNV